MTEQEKKEVIEALKQLEGVKRKLLTIIKTPDSQETNESKGGKNGKVRDWNKVSEGV